MTFSAMWNDSFIWIPSDFLLMGLRQKPILKIPFPPLNIGVLKATEHVFQSLKQAWVNRNALRIKKNPFDLIMKIDAEPEKFQRIRSNYDSHTIVFQELFCLA